LPCEREEPAREGGAEATRIPTLGKYRLLAELARGGMSTVYLALGRGHGDSQKLLVLKELKPELAEDPRILSMFIEEARLAASLNHPNVVRTFEAGSERSRHYIAMEYLDGQSLYRVLSRGRKRGTAVPLEWQLSVLRLALEGLAYAHAASDAQARPLGIVHRDMSPQNIFVGYDGQTKILDFGIAKAAGSSLDTLAGTLKGKVPYMSPEQAIGKPVDARSDVFAVGVMIWEAVAGRRFWSGLEGDVQILHALTRGRRLGEHGAAMADVPKALSDVVIKATAPDPLHRYADAAELLAELHFGLASAGIRRIEPQEVGGFVHHLFAEDRARLQAAIEEAIFSRGPRSGEFPVSHGGQGDARPPSQNTTTAYPQSGIPVLPTTSVPPMPATKATARTREELLADAEDVAYAAQSLRESERIATLPASVQAFVRAVQGVGAKDGAAAFETLANCMEVIERLDEWRSRAVEHLQATARDIAVPVSQAPAPANTGAVTTPPTSVAPVSIESGPPVARRPASPRSLIAAAAIGALFASIGFSVFGRNPATRVEAARPALAPTAATANTTTGQARPRIEKTHAIVSVSPINARIVVDRDVVYENPCVVAFAKDGAIHTLHAEAEGYVPRDETFEASGEATFVLALEPRKAATQPTASKPTAASNQQKEPTHLVHPNSFSPTTHDENP
jgi:serine/threonine protein kinase